MFRDKSDNKQSNGLQKAVSSLMPKVSGHTLLLVTTFATLTTSAALLGSAAIDHFKIDTSGLFKTNNPNAQPELSAYQKELLNSNSGQVVNIPKNMKPEERAQAVKGNIVKVATRTAKQIDFKQVNLDRLLWLAGKESSSNPYNGIKGKRSITKTIAGKKHSVTALDPSTNTHGLFQFTMSGALHDQSYTKQEPVDISPLIGSTKRQHTPTNIHEDRRLSTKEINKIDRESQKRMTIDGTLKKYVGKTIKGVEVTKNGLFNAARAADYKSVRAYLKSNGKESAFNYEWSGKNGINNADDWAKNSELQIKEQVKWSQKNYNKIVKDDLLKYVGKKVAGVKITIEGMQNGAHIGGYNGMKSWVETGGEHNPKDYLETSIRDYVKAGGEASAKQASIISPNDISTSQVAKLAAREESPHEKNFTRG